MTEIDIAPDISIEEIKKKIADTKKQIVDKIDQQKAVITNKLKISNKEGLIDRYTSIDELLIDTIAAIKDLTDEQRQTNETLNKTNQLLLALYFQELGDGTVVRSDSPQALLSPDFIKQITGSGTYITRVLTLENKVIADKELIFEKEFKGALLEVLFVSSTSTTDNKTYGVKIMSDGNIIYNDTWTNFESRSNYETDMAAFEDELNDVYLLQFQNIGFEEKILIEVYDSSATFSRVYIKYYRSL